MLRAQTCSVPSTNGSESDSRRSQSCPPEGATAASYPLPDTVLRRLRAMLCETDDLLQRLWQCDWRIAQARAYLARPGGCNLSLAAIRLADLRRQRIDIVDRLQQIESDAQFVLDIP